MGSLPPDDCANKDNWKRNKLKRKLPPLKTHRQRDGRRRRHGRAARVAIIRPQRGRRRTVGGAHNLLALAERAREARVGRVDEGSRDLSFRRVDNEFIENRVYMVQTF